MGTGASVDVNVPDTHSGLTKRQKIAIRKIWKEIESNVQKHSVKVFLRFFEKHPGYRKYFVSEGGAGMTKVAEDAHVQSHFRAIVASISALIKAITKKPKRLQHRLNYLAMVHKEMGLTMKDFGNFRDVLVEYLKTEFPKQMTVFEITAWNLFLTTMFQRVCARIEELKKQEEAGVTLDTGERKSLIKKIFKGKNQHDQRYWQDRKAYWQTQREMWAENNNESSDEDNEGEKDIGTQITDAMSNVMKNINQAFSPDERAAMAARKSLTGGKRMSNQSIMSQYDVPVPEGGFLTHRGEAPRENAGNMRPRSPSTAKGSRNATPEQPQQNEGCLPCSPARWRRRNSFNDSYQPPPANTR